MKTYVVRGLAPPFFTSAPDGGEWSASSPGRFIPKERDPSTHWTEAEWAPQPVWTLWRTEDSLTPAGNQIPAVQSRSPALYQLSYPTDLKEKLFKKKSNFENEPDKSLTMTFQLHMNFLSSDEVR
jgi:hypothetical protein